MDYIQDGKFNEIEERYPSIPTNGYGYMSCNSWLCSCGQYRKMSEKCVHVRLYGEWVGSKPETIY